ncbi:hypothetical protein [Candidatus Hecatella orcuttiae]|uniref:hypothetical protein n=1 Tax=Candidatus Hecatella orcuttiae TaxID=1935119 RepID=UPI002867C45F|nr:hypothetical protein [Candidatus Hecatella orcuttiae]
MRRARTVRGLLRQLSRCPECRGSPAVFFGNGLSMCQAHWEAYAEAFDYEDGKFKPSVFGGEDGGKAAAQVLHSRPRAG